MHAIFLFIINNSVGLLVCGRVFVTLHNTRSQTHNWASYNGVMQKITAHFYQRLTVLVKSIW